MGILKKLTIGLSTETATLYAYQLLALKNVRSISNFPLSQANALAEGWQLHENDPIYGAGWDAGGAEVKVGVWWDFENCHVPSGIDAHRVGINIVSGLRSSGFKGPVTISGYGDMLQLSRSVQENLSATGIRLHHVPSGGKESESSDRALLMDLILWTIENPPPAHLFLISGDRDFSTALHKLRMRNYNVLLACPVGTSISPSLLGAASRVWYWNSLVRGEGLVATTSWNHDGPPGGSPKFSPLPHSSSPPFPCPPIPPPFSGFPSSSFRAFPAISGNFSPLPPPPPPPPPAPPAPAPSPYVSSIAPPPLPPQATSTATKSGEITTSGNTCSAKSGKSVPDPANAVAHKSNKADASPEMISRLDTILKAHPQGLWMGELQNLMLLKKIQFDSDYFGHKKLVPFLLTLPHIARIERHLMKDSKTWSYMFFSSTAPVSDYKSSSRAGYPGEVLKQLGDLLNQYPKGIWLGELNAQLIARNIRFDSNFYGHLKVVPFLLSMPEMVKVERRLLGDKRTWTYYFMSNQVGSVKAVSAANFAATGKKNGSLETSGFEKKSVSAPAKKQSVYKNVQKLEVAISSSKVPQGRKDSPPGILGEKSKPGLRADKHQEELRAEKNQKRGTPAETKVHSAPTLVEMENAKVEILDSVGALSTSADNNQLPAEAVEKKEKLEYALLKIEDPVETFSSKVAAVSQSIFGFFRRIYQQLWSAGKSEESSPLAIEQGHARESESIAPAGVLCERSINEEKIIEDSYEPAVSLSDGNALGALNGCIVDEKSPEILQKLSFAEGEEYLGNVERQETSTMEKEPSQRHALAKHKTVSKKNKRSVRRGDATVKSTIAKNAVEVKSPRTSSLDEKAESGLYDTHRVQLEQDISFVAPCFVGETTSASTAKASDENLKENVIETGDASELQTNLQCVTSEAVSSFGTVSLSKVSGDSLTENKHRKHLSLPLVQFERESEVAGLSDTKRTMEFNTEKGKADERSQMKHAEGLLVSHQVDENVQGHELPSSQILPYSIMEKTLEASPTVGSDERAATPHEESRGEIQEIISGDSYSMDSKTKSDFVAIEQGQMGGRVSYLAENFEVEPLDRDEIEKPHLMKTAVDASTEAESEVRLEQPRMVHADKSGISTDVTLKQEISESVTVPCEQPAEDNRSAVQTIKEDNSPASIDATRVLKLFERFMENPSTSVPLSKPSDEQTLKTSKSRLDYLASREEVQNLGSSIGSSEVSSFFETLNSSPMLNKPFDGPATYEHASFADAAREYQSLEKPAPAIYTTVVDKTAGATPNVFVDNQQDEEFTISKDDACANRTHTAMEVEGLKEHAFAPSTNEVGASKEIDAVTSDDVQQREGPAVLQHAISTNQEQPLEAHETDKPNLSESLREIPADIGDETTTPKPKRSYKKKRGTTADGLGERPIPIDVLNMFRPLKENPALAKINETNKSSKKRKAGPGMTALVEAAFSFNEMAEKSKKEKTILR